MIHLTLAEKLEVLLALGVAVGCILLMWSTWQLLRFVFALRSRLKRSRPCATRPRNHRIRDYRPAAHVGQVGVRDPDHPCAEFDGAGYDGSGKCYSDGHYMCHMCSHLSPNAPRFNQDDDGE